MGTPQLGDDMTNDTQFANLGKYPLHQRLYLWITLRAPGTHQVRPAKHDTGPHSRSRSRRREIYAGAFGGTVESVYCM